MGHLVSAFHKVRQLAQDDVGETPLAATNTTRTAVEGLATNISVSLVLLKNAIAETKVAAAMKIMTNRIVVPYKTQNNYQRKQ